MLTKDALIGMLRILTRSVSQEERCFLANASGWHEPLPEFSARFRSRSTKRYFSTSKFAVPKPWVAGVERSEPPEIPPTGGSLRSTPATPRPNLEVRYLALTAVLLIAGCAGSAAAKERDPQEKPPMNTVQKLEKATFGAGCFWCSEAVFLRLRGVQSVASGYSGGQVPDPTYEQVCTGTTGHAECVQVTYDSAVISYLELLEVFFKTHDPTTLNRQGPDVGTQYRSVIFYHDDQQRSVAEKTKAALDESGALASRIVTQIVSSAKFYPAEKYHQDYFGRNPRQPYCAAVVRPKVEKFEKVFREKLKPQAASK